MPFLELHLIVWYSSNRSDSIDIIDSTDISDSYEKLLIWNKNFKLWLLQNLKCDNYKTQTKYWSCYTTLKNVIFAQLKNSNQEKNYKWQNSKHPDMTRLEKDFYKTQKL